MSAACSANTAPEEPQGEQTTLFTPEALEGWTEMRDCRHSHEHELRFIRVLVDDAAKAPYAALSEEVPYPTGCTLVKLEYDDRDCTNLLGYTVLRKLDSGAAPLGGDWRWQKVDTDLTILEDGAPTHCIGCHVEHCAPPNGFDLTCAEEI